MDRKLVDRDLRHDTSRNLMRSHIPQPTGNSKYTDCDAASLHLSAHIGKDDASGGLDEGLRAL